MQGELHILQEQIQTSLAQHGTNLAVNAADLQGDGDQSPIQQSPQQQQFYRDLFSQGGDFAECFATPGYISEFAQACVTGAVSRVKALLEEADRTDQPRASPALLQLLETRETSMRVTPLLMLVSVGKNIASGGDPRQLGSNQLAVAELLLHYGARPDAKDVCGKTVVHYGAGAMATETTMDIVEVAAQAYQSSFLFHQEVELFGLDTTTMNGKRGVARGYSKGRRAVFLYDQNKSVLVRPENIKLVSGDHVDGKTNDRNLCNVQDRLGATSVLETVMTGRADVAEFLAKTLGASIDIQDCDGISARSMVMTSAFSEMTSPAAAVIKEVALRRAKDDAKMERRKCFNCEKEEPKGQTFARCDRCKVVRYCSRDCQVAHWKVQHKKECKALAKKPTTGVKLERPPSSGMFTTSFNARTGQAAAPKKDTDGYRKPDHVSVDEMFYIKCQGGSPSMPIMIYDKTRQCEFYYSPGMAGYDEIRSKINAEPAFQGRKTYMKASFDREGLCTVYPNTTTLKKW